MHRAVISANKEISREECFVSAALDFNSSVFTHLLSHARFYSLIFSKLDLLKYVIFKTPLEIENAH